MFGINIVWFGKNFTLKGIWCKKRVVYELVEVKKLFGVKVFWLVKKLLGKIGTVFVIK